MMIQKKTDASTARLKQLGAKLGALLLGLIPAFAASHSAEIQLQFNGMPLSQALMAQLPAGETPDDPRAAAIASRLTGALYALQQGQFADARGVLPPRSTAGATAAQSHVDRSRKTIGAPTHDGVRPSLKLEGADMPAAVIRLRGDGTARSISAPAGRLLQPRVSGAGKAADDESTVRTFLRTHRQVLAIADPDSEFELRSRQFDRLGHRHLRFAQTFSNLPVWRSEIIAQLDRDGNLITLNGAYEPTPRKLVTTVTVSAEQAQQVAGAAFGDQGGSDPRLVIFAHANGMPRLAWEVRVSVDILHVWNVLVDAHNGSILNSFSEVASDNVAGSGVDLFGNTQALNVWEEGGLHYMVDTSKAMFNPASDPPQPVSSDGVIVVLDAVNEPQTNNLIGQFVAAGAASGPWLADAVSAATNLSATYDYFLADHQHDSVDDDGASLLAFVRVDQGLANAFYNFATRTMYFGDAGPWAGSLDVVAHEITHGVVAESAGLVYQDQSGALNESFADIFGEMVEADRTGQTDWKMGSQLGNPLRNMADPGSLTTFLGGPYPSRMSEYIFTSEDSGGVHLNSSIHNHAFYLLAVGLPNAIGAGDAAEIFYRALTTKLSAQSQFVDARFAAIQSAEELFGIDSAQANATTEAFDAVEIFDVETNPGPSPHPAPEAPDSTLFVFKDGPSNQFFLGRQEDDLGDPPQGVLLSTNPARSARPSVSGDGTFAAFVNAQRDMCLISTDGSSPELCLGFPGLIGSVAMAPDGETFGFVLLDAMGNADNKISVIDVATEDTQTFELVAPVYDGVTSAEIVSADTMDFTADNRFLFYDAFNRLRFTGGTSLGLWSIYAIDLLTGGTIAVAPPVQGFEVAYPSLAQTSDSHMTFDVFDIAAGQNFTAARDISTGATAAVAVTDGFSIPGYTGDDKGIVFSAPDTAGPTGFSLMHQAVAEDRITPTGSPSLWLADADAGAVYRRGDFTGPTRVDLQTSQTVSTAAGHRAVFQLNILNQGPDTATGVQLTDVLPSNVTVAAVTTSEGTCNVTGTEVQCSMSDLGAGASASVTLELQAQVVASLSNSVTAFAAEHDLAPADNTAFATVDRADLNIAPTSTAISGRTATEGAAFTLNVSSSFTDADSDPLTYEATGLPGSLTISAASGVISGTPGTADVRSMPYAVQVTAADTAGASTSETFNLTVNAGGGGGGGGGGGSSGGGGGGGSNDFAFLLLMFAFLVKSIHASTTRRRA